MGCAGIDCALAQWAYDSGAATLLCVCLLVSHESWQPRHHQHPKKPQHQTFQIDAGAAERPVEEYNTLQEFFTRRLKPGLRPVAAEGCVGVQVEGVLTVSKHAACGTAAVLSALASNRCDDTKPGAILLSADPCSTLLLLLLLQRCECGCQPR